MEERYKFDFLQFTLTQQIDAKGQCNLRTDQKVYIPNKLKDLMQSKGFSDPQDAINKTFFARKDPEIDHEPEPIA